MHHSENETRRHFLQKTLQRSAAGLLAASAFSPLISVGRDERPLNVICFLIDDMGWRDLSCYGSDLYRTPNIDRLTQQGMRFTQAYSSCTVCSPTRASVLTGKYPQRVNITDWIPGHLIPDQKLVDPQINQALPSEEVTLAERLKQKGYATAQIGKWHLGPEETVTQQGFDINLGGTHRGQPPSYFAPYKISTLQEGPEGEYLTDRMGEEANRFIERNREKPFYLQLNHFAVHTPIQSKDELTQKYEPQLKEGQPPVMAKYASMIESLDDSIGQVMAKLDELGIAENTVIFFMSDNGGLSRVTDNAPLREGKGTAYEGGVRVPMIVRWPGRIPAGVVSDVLTISMDFYTTVCALTGIDLPAGEPIDGVDLTPVLTQRGSITDRNLYWHYPHYHTEGGNPYSAIRSGDYKLIEYLEDRRLELYNLKEDIEETHDLSMEMPEKALELYRQMNDWRKEVGAKMPRLNMDYDPAKAAARWERRR